MQRLPELVANVSLIFMIEVLLYLAILSVSIYDFIDPWSSWDDDFVDLFEYLFDFWDP